MKVKSIRSFWDKKVLALTLFVITCSSNIPMIAQAEQAIVEFPGYSFETNESEDYVLEGSMGEAAGEVAFSMVNEKPFVTDGSEALKVDYGAGGWPGLMVRPAEDHATWDFSDENKILAFDVYNPSEAAQALNIKYDSNVSGYGNGRVFSTSIPAKQTSTVFVLASDNALQLGMKTMPPMSGNGIIAGKAWDEKEGEFNAADISQISFWILSNTKDCTLYFDNMRIVADPNANPEEGYKNLVDEFGQYTAAEWDTKIHSVQELIDCDKAEKELLETMQASIENRTVYGGFKDDSLKQEATGRFYTMKLGGQWTMIDPEGYPYFATGVDIVRTADMNTWITGREFMFENLNDVTKEFPDHIAPVGGTLNPPMELEEGEVFNFYSANLERKYGADWVDEWTQMTLKRFKAWGMTSIGCWAEPTLFYGKGEENEMVYAAHAWTHEGGTFVKIGDSGVADPFDPAFETATNEIIKQTADQGVADDPYCMGIYVDNEISWGNAKTGTEHYILVETAMNLNAQDSPSKAAFVELMKENYTSIEELNEVWGSTFGSFEDMKQPYNGSIPDSDKSKMLFTLADKYYGIVDAALNTYMPEVLYLGSRLAVWGTSEEIVDACKQYVDILSFNSYTLDIENEWMNYERYDLPMIIGEFHFNATDNGYFAPGLVPVASSAERGTAYANYVKSALLNGRFVGTHWFQYYDQPVMGRAWDGENTNTGFVNVADQPYAELVESAREINDNMYTLKFLRPNVEEVVLDQSDMNLNKENPTEQLNVTVSPDTVADKSVVFESSNPNVAVVDQDGNVTAKAEGKTVIIATSNTTAHESATCIVTVGSMETEGGNAVNEPATFPGYTFEDDRTYFVQGAKAESEIIDGVDGGKALKVTMTENTNDWTGLTKVEFMPSSGEQWNLGSAKAFSVTVTNPGTEAYQLRINVMDGPNTRTLYYPMAAEETKTLVVDAVKLGEVGVANDCWDAEGHFGNGVDSTNITSISFYLPEGDTATMNGLISASFIIEDLQAVAVAEDLGEAEKAEIADEVAGVVIVDKTVYAQKIELIRSFLENQYTQESWKEANLSKSIDAAIKVFDNADATNEEVGMQLVTLLSDASKLVLKPISSVDTDSSHLNENNIVPIVIGVFVIGLGLCSVIVYRKRKSNN